MLGGTEVGESLTFLQFTFGVPWEFCTRCIYYAYTKTAGLQFASTWGSRRTLS